ncbi:MAG: NAD(P)H-hydrate epimerase [Candidatus Helarchaeota archaeon]
MRYLPFAQFQIPVITPDEMREIDRLTVKKYELKIIQMMENAGKSLAEIVKRSIGNSVINKRILVAVGGGNNGGGGLAAARHLLSWGAKITIFLPPEPLKNTSKLQYQILSHRDVEMIHGRKAYQYLPIGSGDVIIDALVGYGLSGPPKGWVSKIIRAINYTQIPVIALDIPSGLDANTGKIYNPCIKATATLTLALPKTGLVVPLAKKVVGTLYLADLTIPNMLYKELGWDVPSLFTQNTIIKLWNGDD